MAVESTMVSAGGFAWQDYRASNTGMAILYGSDPISELPIREVPEAGRQSEVESEPNYETGTFGCYSCARTKIRSTFVKSKIRYLMFITKYAGTLEDYQGRYFVTGFYRITKTADVKRHHIRTYAEYSCLDEKVCYALRAEESRFVAVADAFEVTPQALKEWGFSGRLTRQSRILMNEEQTAKVVDYLRGKADIRAEYVEETARLQPNADEEDEDEE
ncbi:MAG: hypothetical protein FWC23_07310 [Chitinispirillia bacterium]|nr:hypothetical protein [Chitinispirillia bacterium]MCL2268976.1 hypothetical protein [Chitinispirillia bacterium]